ncbi:MAG: hypothetical protein VYA88_02235 [Actinomycetota bacterium]|nr:hypothetical protein [Actinomycetota bacterium]
MNEYPVRAGSMLYTLVDPNKGHEVAYNRWYERDHFYAGCLIGPWLFAGKRWVATRELKDLRFPSDSSVTIPTDRGSYLATYFVLEGKHDEHFKWAAEQVWNLYANDRGFPERQHAHTVMFNSPWAYYRDENHVPIELSFDHPYKGLGNVFLDRSEGTSEDELRDYLESEALPALLSSESQVASCVNWKPIPRNDDIDGNAPMDLGSPTGNEERTNQMFFLEDDPRNLWDLFHDYANAINESGLASVSLAAPFIPTIVGTDIYTDQLW